VSATAAPWWESAFRADYLSVYAHRDDASAAREVAAWMNRLPGLRAGARALDLCCGAGRHMRALGASGVDATGLDFSADLLAAARTAGSGRLVRGDMRSLPFASSTFDAVLSFFSSFGYFDSREEDFRVLAEVERVLRPSGGFLLDLPDPETVRRSLIPHSRKELDGVIVEESRRLTEGGRRVEKSVVLRDGDGERRWTESLWLHDPATVMQEAAERGLTCLGTAGDHAAGTTRAILWFVKGDLLP
jgi:SAM-dependent methyltransferase